MFIISTHVAESAIDGSGVFASVSVKKGEVVWAFEPTFDREYTSDQVKRFPKVVQEHIFKCGYLDKRTNTYFLGVDYDIFTNHSDNPTLIENTPTSLIASRDIAPNEELTQNYYEYDNQQDIDWKFSIKKPRA